ncbi:hypothetical protein EYZ11_010350 [Aspergillus tanneri]|uniref:Uncharacterized protein n=1 Tax=Aspergillus tanneri TaxID=1220188 RepID=A0A4S3J650_9EURO|nr:hypothetical protein EYZ11_010350 [Aspergillus tanneri]
MGDHIRSGPQGRPTSLMRLRNAEKACTYKATI